MQELHFEKNYHQYQTTQPIHHSTYAPLGIIHTRGSDHLSQKINNVLFNRRLKALENDPNLMRNDSSFLRQDFRIPTKFIRFSSGEGKVVIDNTVRGHDLYYICDVSNHGCSYTMFNQEIPMSPDEHYQDLKRAILAACGRARRISVIMPYLYESRQYMRLGRESLDCAMMIQELFSLGVNSIITFDPHEPRVENASPTECLNIIPATYQLLAAFFEEQQDLQLKGQEALMVVSQDEKSMKRAMYYASVLEVPLGAFYRKRDYSQLVDGHNPIIDYKYMGDQVEGRDIVIVDDMFVSGSSFLQTARMLKEKKAKRVFGIATFGMFADGLEKYEEFYTEGYFDKLYVTNLHYLPDELYSKPWIKIVDMSELIAYIIDAMNYNVSIASLLDHTTAIKELLHARK